MANGSLIFRIRSGMTARKHGCENCREKTYPLLLPAKKKQTSKFLLQQSQQNSSKMRNRDLAKRPRSDASLGAPDLGWLAACPSWIWYHGASGTLCEDREISLAESENRYSVKLFRTVQCVQTGIK